MLNGFQIAATGLAAAQQNVDTIGHNLANVNSTAFKRGVVTFQELLTNVRNQNNFPVRQEAAVGAGSRAGLQRDWAQGPLITTGNPWDLAIEGPGFLEVSLPDGQTGFTRAGTLKQDAEGYLVTANGHRLAAGIYLDPGYTSPVITPQGEVLAQDEAGEEVWLGYLDLFYAPHQARLLARGEGIYTSDQPLIAGTPGTNGLGFLRQGSLEASNVKLEEEMTNLLEAQRYFQFNATSLSTANEMWRMVNNLR